MLLGVLIVSLGVGLAYQALPPRFALPLFTFALLVPYFVVLYVMARGGLDAAEGEALALAAMMGLVGFLVGPPALSLLRQAWRRRTVDV
ncbi:hypothetical protein [Aquipuribacter hungaricus]|uniref:hypothetical protein n=1 Tax=Aquipuribacter hungaricus TaxID=545624 RepID=UPI00366BF302